MKKSYFLKRRSLQHTSDMLTTHCHLRSRTEADEFLTKLNCLHPSLRFTFEKKTNVYRFLMFTSKEQVLALKPVFTETHFHWPVFALESFSTLKRKISLISTLVHQALMICTKRRLNGKIEWIKKMLLDNGYPENVINAQTAKKIAQFSTLKRFDPEKYPVYLRIPWIGKLSTNLEKEVKTAVESCFGSVSVRLVFTSKRMLACGLQECFTYHSEKFCDI